MTFADKIELLLRDLGTLNTALNMLRRYPEATQVQRAIEGLSCVSIDGSFQDSEWPRQYTPEVDQEISP
jgi:hypothetical protein